ncbi:hypothetical protein DOTSEDRAFT_62725 [Dothistroma septosporum NZE10]|uniref:Enoyl reductase (ER) domain-containing protein n=1 Tax=Dothistroma septosporum (strain NZE10 / CBS 128990) TaxID=675120 RepID=N1PMU8_DOTSN|nr:hypothetical protein DOTSEDRAFT_62725 [Dothistroma septosporum NZE10]
MPDRPSRRFRPNKSPRLRSSTPTPIRTFNGHLIHVHAVSLQTHGPKGPQIAIVHRLALPNPCIPGFDVVGEIVALADGSSLEPGQIAFGLSASTLDGGAALVEYTAVPADVLVTMSKGMEMTDVASIPTGGSTAYQSVVSLDKHGDKVSTNGGFGGVGTHGIQFAKIVGAHVVASCSRRNVEVCWSLGADAGRPFDFVVDNVCNGFDLYCKMHTFSSSEAKYMVVGWGPSLAAIGFILMASLTVEGKLKAVIDSSSSIENTVNACRKLKSGRAVGKIVEEVAGK